MQNWRVVLLMHRSTEEKMTACWSVANKMRL